MDNNYVTRVFLWLINNYVTRWRGNKNCYVYFISLVDQTSLTKLFWATAILGKRVRTVIFISAKKKKREREKLRVWTEEMGVAAAASSSEDDIPLLLTQSSHHPHKRTGLFVIVLSVSDLISESDDVFVFPAEMNEQNGVVRAISSSGA